jgi:hypothetical protein
MTVNGTDLLRNIFPGTPEESYMDIHELCLDGLEDRT